MLQHETRRPRYTERNTEVTKRNTADVTARDKKAKVYGKEHRGYEKERS